MKIMNGIKGNATLIWVALIALMCCGILAVASETNAGSDPAVIKDIPGDNPKATCTFVGSNPMNDQVTHEFTITWGTSADTTETIKVPFEFSPEYILTYQWDLNACYTDGETLWIDESTYTPTAAVGTDARGTIDIYRSEILTNDGCESGAVCEFILLYVGGSK